MIFYASGTNTFMPAGNFALKDNFFSDSFSTNKLMNYMPHSDVDIR